MNLQRFVASLVATLFCWLSIALVVPVTQEGSLSRAIVVVVAFWVTAELWVGWVRSIYKDDEKAKRDADSNATLTLLMELLDDDERHAVKQRLVDQVQSDGETSPLAELLAHQEAQAKQGAR